LRLDLEETDDLLTIFHDGRGLEGIRAHFISGKAALVEKHGRKCMERERERKTVKLDVN
jgi:hypothetical protein